jgi:arsenate reductase (glutaredoxin)
VEERSDGFRSAGPASSHAFHHRNRPPLEDAILGVMAVQPVRIFHNPRCSKSREALALLRERGLEPDVVLYVEAPPSARELAQLVRMLGITPHALLRTEEEAYARAGLNEKSSLEEVAQAIGAAPSLLERPVVVVGDKAVIARPPERLLELL